MQEEDISGLTLDEIVRLYAPLVRRTAGYFRVHYDTEQDLIQAGLMALAEAAGKYDKSIGANFTTYATYRIRGAMLDWMRQQDTMTRTTRQHKRHIDRATIELSNNHVEPSEEAIAEHLGITLESVQDLRIRIENAEVVYFSDIHPSGTDSSGNISEPIFADGAREEPLSRALRIEREERISEAIGRLPTREQAVISLYDYGEFTMKETADMLGITESRVSQLHTQACSRLRQMLHKEDFL